MIERAHEGGPEIDVEDIHVPPQPKIPRTVAIVACGQTAWDWHASQFTYERQIPKVDAVWTLNKALRTVKCDLGFVLDDLVGECRKSPEYYEDLRGVTVPIITSTIDPTVRQYLPQANLHEYPIAAVIHYAACRVLINRGMKRYEMEKRPDLVHQVGVQAAYYLHNSVPMILAYALLMNVHGVQLWGADYTFPGTQAREEDRPCAEYWVAMLRMAGIEVMVSGRSTLLNASKQPWIYGYGARPPVIEPPSQDELMRLTERAYSAAGVL